MALAADEEVVECQHPLTIVQVDLRQGDLADLGSVLGGALHRLPGLTDVEGQKNAVDPLRIRVDGHDGQIAHVFGSVRHQPVSTDHDDGDAPRKSKVGRYSRSTNFNG